MSMYANCLLPNIKFSHGCCAEIGILNPNIITYLIYYPDAYWNYVGSQFYQLIAPAHYALTNNIRISCGPIT